MKNTVKKIIGLALILGTFSSIPALASANHGAVVNRNGLWADAYAYTYWDTPHCTKVSVGIKSATDAGTYYSCTKTITAMGSATSGYWET